MHAESIVLLLRFIIERSAGKVKFSRFLH